MFSSFSFLFVDLCFFSHFISFDATWCMSRHSDTPDFGYLLSVCLLQPLWIWLFLLTFYPFVSSFLSPPNPNSIPLTQPYKNHFRTTQHNDSTVRLHLVSTCHCCLVRRIRSFPLLYQRSQQAGSVAASGLIISGMWVVEVGQGAWWCLVWVDIPYPSGRSRWTSGTVREQRRGGGCCRPSALPRSGRTQPQRALTASRSTFLKPRLDSESRLTHPFPPPRSPLPMEITPLHQCSVIFWVDFCTYGDS